MTGTDPLVVAARSEAEKFLPAGSDAHVARAPGRLDVLGGVADYSGGRVLEMPLDCAVVAVATSTGDGRVVARTTDPTCGKDLEVPVAVALDVQELARCARADPSSRWAAYALGPLAILSRARNASCRGLRILVHGDVPVGAGVASSAAVEVASLRACAGALGIDVASMDVARLAQAAEHEVAGAPCGLMDQVTVACGSPGRLLPLLCRPMTREPEAELPDGWQLSGVVSGVRHSVSGDAYARARAAAFMGRALVADGVDLDALPESITGATFRDRGLDHGDPLTTIDPDVSYPVRAATEHPVLATRRVDRFLDACAALNPVAAGTCLDEGHVSYGALGLGCAETDHIASEARARGAWGARASAGGSGGTVVVLHPSGMDFRDLGTVLTSTRRG